MKTLLYAAGILVAATSMICGQTTLWDDILRPQMSPTTVDVRSAGMGGVAVAGITGSNAIFTNPAAIGATQKSSIALGVEGRLGAIKNEHMDGQFDSYRSSYKPYLQLTHISAALPISIKDSPLGFAIGVGYHDQYTASRTNYTKQVESDGTTTEIYAKYRGSMNLISPTIALSIKNKFGIGLAINQSLPSVFGKVTAVTKTNGVESANVEYIGSAFFLTVGLRLSLLKDKLALGCAYYSPAQWTFTKGENEEGDFTAPRMFTLGGQLQVTKQLLAALEFQTRFFASMPATTEGDELSNGVALRLGGEYNLDPLLVRLGINLENVPSTDMVQPDGDLIAPKDKSPQMGFGANAGVGIPLKPLTINAALGWSRFGYDNEIASAGDTKTYAYSENHFKLDLGITLDLPGARVGRGETMVDEGADAPEPLDIGK